MKINKQVIARLKWTTLGTLSLTLSNVLKVRVLARLLSKDDCRTDIEFIWDIVSLILIPIVVYVGFIFGIVKATIALTIAIVLLFLPNWPFFSMEDDWSNAQRVFCWNNKII